MGGHADGDVGGRDGRGGGLVGRWRGRCGTISRPLEGVAQLHPPGYAVGLIPADQHSFDRDGVVWQAFVGGPVPDLLVAEPDVAGESPDFPRHALIWNARRPGSAPQVPIQQIAEGQAGGGSIVSGNDMNNPVSISEHFKRGEDRFRDFAVFERPAQPQMRGPAMFDQLYHNPPVVLYLLQACTYGAAAVLSPRSDHRLLTICYLTSALLHGLLGACQLMHLG